MAGAKSINKVKVPLNAVQLALVPFKLLQKSKLRAYESPYCKHFNSNRFKLQLTQLTKTLQAKKTYNQISKG